MSTSTCSSCKHPNPAGSKFCIECGTPLSSAATTPSTAVAPALPSRPPPQPTASPIDPNTPKSFICPYCQTTCGDLLDKVVGDQHYHLNCFNCSQCFKYLGHSGFFHDPRFPGKLLCASCKDTALPHEPSESRGYTPRRVAISSKSATNCAKCGKQVFEMERFKACEAVWHRACFCCTDCGVKLDPRYYETRNSEPYCKTCYVKH